MDFEGDIVRQLEIAYGTRDVLHRRALAREALDATPGERVLDVGCGPGFYAAELAEVVGREGAVVGVDPSAAMRAVAEGRCAEHPQVSLLDGDALALPVEDASFDACLTVQVLEYVPDVPAALAEMRRVLRRGGRLVVWDVDWSTLSWHSEDPERMRRVLDEWDKHLVHRDLPRRLGGLLRAGGFTDVALAAHPFATIEADPETYGGQAVPLIEKFVTPLVGEETASAWATEQRELGERGEFYFSVTQCCFTAVRG